MTIYNDVPHSGKHVMTSSGAVPGKEITSEKQQRQQAQMYQKINSIYLNQV